MAKTRRIGPDRRFIMAMALLLGLGPSPGAAAGLLQGAPLRDAPVIWYADDTRPIPVPAFDEPGIVPFASQAFVAGPVSRFFRPSRLVRKLDDGYAGRPAGDVNSLGEVVNSTWFTNRIGLYPMAPEEVALGPGQPEGPDRGRPWEIIGAKVGGVTPGFRIRDGRGDVWLLKFDPPDYPGMSTRSGVVSNLLFHAMGYSTPVDRVVFFDLDDLSVGEGATMRLPRSGKVRLTLANLESVLENSNCREGDHYVALASKFLAGQPLGPFKSQGLREDDPNDRVRHENRRTLRALKVFAAWLNHFDTKMHNSLDVYVGEPGAGHVEHNLIDFASTLGTFGATPVKRFGYEFGIDVGSIIGRMVTLGFMEDDWVYLERPAGLDEVGYFDVETFDPTGWEPDIPHSAMANLTREDGYWAAKVLSRFTEAQIRAAVEQGRYQNPRAVDYLVQTLRGRQEKLVRHWFAEVPPLDFFQLRDEELAFEDLLVTQGFHDGQGTRYRGRLSPVNARREGADWSAWREGTRPLVDLRHAPIVTAERPFLAVEVQVDRGDGWSDGVIAYLAPATGRLVAVTR